MTPADLDALALTVLGQLTGAAVRACALAAAAGLLLAALRVGRAAVRLVVWTVVLAALCVMPALSAVAPALHVPLPVTAPSVRWRVEEVTPAPRIADEPASRRAAGAVDTAASVPAPALQSNNRLSNRARAWWPVAVLGIYLAGIGVLLVRFGIGWRMSRRLVRAATVVSDEAARLRLRRHVRVSGRTGDVAFAESADVAVPVVAGVVRPVVLLPAGWREWEAATLDAVLVHEGAHIARRDALAQRLALVYRLVFWFNPIAWWLARHLAELGDEASDEAVLDRGLDRVVYAGLVVDFLRALNGRTHRAVWHVAMASRISAERRIERILRWQKGGPAVTRLVITGIALAGVPVVLLAASARPAWRELDASVLPPPPATVRSTAEPMPAAPMRLTRPASPASTEPRVRAGEPVEPQAPAQNRSEVAPAPRMDQSSSLDAFAPIRIALRGERLVALAFNARVPAADLQNLVLIAQSFVDLGLPASDLVSVSVLGPKLEVLQDFSADQNTLHHAIAQVSVRQMGAAVAGPSPLAAVQGVCNNLNRLQQDSFVRLEVGIIGVPNVIEQTALVYFDSGVERGLEAPVQVRALANACTNDGVVFLGVGALGHVGPFLPRNTGVARLNQDLVAMQAIGTRAGPSRRPPPRLSIAAELDHPPATSVSRLGSRAGPATGIAMGVVSHQRGSPIRLAGLRSMLDNGAASVRVRNGSTKAVRSITLGAIVWPNDTREPTVHAGQASPVTLEPGGTVEIASEVLHGAALPGLEAQGAVAKIGVVRVEFADGSAWTYDVVAHGDFAYGGGD